MASAAPELEPSSEGPRKRVLLRGTLFTPQGPSVVWIRDVSPTAAQVSCKDRLAVGSDVILKRGGVFAAAHVASSDEAGAEVKFYRRLSDGEVTAATLPVPGPA